jgi:subtilisin-like proprotein convertase family protein
VTNSGFEAFTDVSFPGGGLVKLRLRVSTAQGSSTFVLSMPTATATTHTAFHGTGPVDIPDRSRVPGVMAIPVSGFEGSVQRVVLRVHVTHPDLSGLTLRLVAPDGEAATLVRVGDLSGSDLGTGCPAGVNDTTFDAEAAMPLSEGSAPYAGAFRVPALAELEGKSGATANGTWRLEVTDNIGSYGTVSTGRIECARLLLHGAAAATGGYVEVRLAGVVTDAETGLPLEGATVSTATGFSTVTGADGAYSLDVLPGTFDVVASAPAHDAVRVVVTATGGTQTVDFALPSVVLAASSVVVDDAGAGGNSSGVADRNERFRLSIAVANSGAAAATGVSAVLSTSAAGVTILQDVSAYPDIPPGGVAANVNAFELQTAEDFVPGRPVDLRLTVQHDQGAVTIPIALATGTPLASPTAFEASGPVAITTDAVNGARLLISVTGVGSSASKVVIALHVNHPDASRVTLRLEGPDGTRVTLVDRIPSPPPPGPDFGTDCPAGANDTTFDDAATLWIGTAHVPRAGTFRPEQPLAAFTGKDPNGTWTLRAFHNGGATGTLECARLLIYGYASADAMPPADRIFADGFESGDLSAWSGRSTDNGDVRAVADAALAGQFGLETVVNDTQALHVRDETPDGEPRYRVRFSFDPNGFDPGEAAGNLRAIVFMALDESPQKRVVQIILRRLGGAYSLRGRVTLDDGTRAETPFVPITDAPHVVELDWVQASAPGASDGSFQLWIDGTSTPALTGLDNDEHAVDLVRLGAMVVKPGAAGSLYFDRFDSRRATYIGP